MDQSDLFADNKHKKNFLKGLCILNLMYVCVALDSQYCICLQVEIKPNLTNFKFHRLGFYAKTFVETRLNASKPHLRWLRLKLYPSIFCRQTRWLGLLIHTVSSGVIFPLICLSRGKNSMRFSSPLTFVGKRSEEALSGRAGLMGDNFVQKVSEHWEETALVNTVVWKKRSG